MCIQINNAKQKRESSPTTAQIKEGLNSLEHKTIQDFEGDKIASEMARSLQRNHLPEDLSRDLTE